MPGMTISEAAAAWRADRSTIKRWIAQGRIEAIKDNSGIWRIAPGQQPPPSLERHQGSVRAAPSSPPQELALAQRELAELREVLAETKLALAQAERDRDVSRREVELLREQLADRDRLHDLLREALARPSWIERLLRAIRGAKASAGEGH